MKVLSCTVGLALKERGHIALSKFIFLVDHWFDLMNTGLVDYKRKLKPNMAPYTDCNDERLKWLVVTLPGMILSFISYQRNILFVA